MCEIESDRCPKCHFKYRKNGECFCSDEGKTIYVINDIPEHYNRGLGMIIKNRQQYRQELRERRMIEVGNEKNYIDPIVNEKSNDKKIDTKLKELRPDAFNMLNQIEIRNSGWN